MQTITFYSYKGGVGRTLFLANVARFLSKLRQKVFVIDLDLEAPGLHYKFDLECPDVRRQVGKGMLDYIHSFSVGQGVPESLKEYVVEVEGGDEGAGAIYLMAAGDAPSTEYWRKLAQVNWHDLFYAEGAKGIPFFLELKEQIDRQYGPDFLLIDSRTGITEVGGVATSILSDKLVCLLIMNRENLEGARAVLRSVKRTPRLHGQSPVELLPVLTRIPLPDSRPKGSKLLLEGEILDSVREFLNAETANLSDTLNITHIFVLHSEPELQVSESIRIGSGRSLSESPLLRDYVLLLSQLISRESIEPHMGALLQEALEKAEGDPESARVMLESLTAYCPHPATYHALLKFYASRGVDAKEILEKAIEFWQVTGMVRDSLLQELVRENFNQQQFPYLRPPVKLLEFGEAVWRAAGGDDVRTGLFIAQGYRAQHRSDGVEILRALVGHSAPDDETVVEYLEQLGGLRRWKAAFKVIYEYKKALAHSNKFRAAWASLIVGTGNAREAKSFLQEVDLNDFNVVTPLLAVQLLLLVDRTDDIGGLLRTAFDQALQEGGLNTLLKVGEVYKGVGRRAEFETMIHEHFSPGEAATLLRRIFHRWGLPGMPNP